MQCRDTQRSAEILAMIQDEVNDHFAHGRFERQKLILFDLFITFNRQELRANAEDNAEILDISSYMQIPDVDGLRAYFQECLCLLIGRSHRIQAPDHMRPILDYIHANYNRNVPLSVLASRFFYSQGYLGRVLKEATGLSYIEYVTRLRVEHAMTLLKSSPKSIGKQLEVGYKDPNYFSKVFKRMCGKARKPFAAGYSDRAKHQGGQPADGERNKPLVSWLDIFIYMNGIGWMGLLPVIVSRFRGDASGGSYVDCAE